MTKITETEQRAVFIILRTRRTAAGEYIPCIVKEGERGYFITDWSWGTDFAAAEELASQRNAAAGINENEALRIVCSSMFN